MERPGVMGHDRDGRCIRDLWLNRNELNLCSVRDFRCHRLDNSLQTFLPFSNTNHELYKILFVTETLY